MTQVFAKRWELLSQLESLASGTLYAIKDKNNNRQLIGKKLPIASSTKHESASMPKNFFYQTPLIAIENEGDSTLLVFDISLEASLSSELDIKTFSFKQSGKLVVDLAEGLKELHEANQVHGRLLPDSCLISKAGSILLSESNLRWAWNNISPYELPYLDPLAEPTIRTAETDIYAFGILLYQIATAHIPFSVRKLEELKSREKQIPPPTGKLSSSWPLHTFELIEGCTSLDNNKRIKNMATVIDFLTRLKLPTRTSVTINRPINRKIEGVRLQPQRENLWEQFLDSILLKALVFLGIIYLLYDLIR